MLSHHFFLLSTAVTIRYELFINTTFNKSLGMNDSKEYNTTCDTYGKIVRVHTHTHTHTLSQNIDGNNIITEFPKMIYHRNNKICNVNLVYFQNYPIPLLSLSILYVFSSSKENFEMKLVSRTLL